MTKNIFALVIFAIALVACSDSSTDKMTVSGNIIGLKKGTLLLQKMKDTVLTSVDSIVIDGDGVFELVATDVEPEIYYLTLKEKGRNKIPFFAEKGNITINSKLEKLNSSVKIEGSKRQKLLEEYKDMINQFNDKRLDLVKESFEAQTAKDDELIEKLDKDLQRLTKRRYLYSANFSVKNAKSEVAPYIALTELYDAHISLLDTVNNALSKKVKASKYGKKLDAFIKDIKKNEQ